MGLGLPLQGPGWTEYARVRGMCGCAGEKRETLCACSPITYTRNSCRACFCTPPASPVSYQFSGRQPCSRNIVRHKVMRLACL